MKLNPPSESINFSPTPLQHEAWKYLMDKETNILLFGGSAGSGKSYLGCVYIVLMCLQYPGVVMGLTRARIIDLERSTLITLQKVLKSFGLSENVNYKYDRKLNIITFYNDSKIMMFDSFSYPTDPEFERISSTEFTGVVIDEASQVSKKAYNIIQTRIRLYHEKYNLIPKLLVVSNPTQNFLKSEVYQPFIDGTLPVYTKCVLGLVSDNPYIDQSYIDNLERLDGPTRARLLYGDWDYASSDDSIFDPDKLVNIFHNNSFINNDKTKYITCDVASSGADRSVFTVWEGLDCIKIESHKHLTIPQLYDRAKVLMSEYNVYIHNVIVDKTGVGVGLYDMLKGCIGFIANERPKTEIYKMLKDEFYYKFSEYVNSSKIKISFNGYKDEIVQELAAHTMFNYDKDNNKTQILPKDKVKQSIGRSPDIADALVMRMNWEVKVQGFTFTML